MDGGLEVIVISEFGGNCSKSSAVLIKRKDGEVRIVISTPSEMLRNRLLFFLSSFSDFTTIPIFSLSPSVIKSGFGFDRGKSSLIGFDLESTRKCGCQRILSAFLTFHIHKTQVLFGNIYLASVIWVGI